MDIRHGLQVLELDRTATLDELRQAYKDMVNVWHPDRFAHNPRLKAKAEGKLKEINEAYAVVEPFLASEPLPGKEHAVVKRSSRSTPTQDANRQNAGRRAPATSMDRTEAVVEAGTRLFLTACSYLYKKLSDFVAEQTSPSNPKRTPVEPSRSSDQVPRAEECHGPRRARRQGRHCGCGSGARKG